MNTASRFLKFSNYFEDLIQDLFPRHIFRHLDVVGVLLPATGGLKFLDAMVRAFDQVTELYQEQGMTYQDKFIHEVRNTTEHDDWMNLPAAAKTHRVLEAYRGLIVLSTRKVHLKWRRLVEYQGKGNMYVLDRDTLDRCNKSWKDFITKT